MARKSVSMLLGAMTPPAVAAPTTPAAHRRFLVQVVRDKSGSFAHVEGIALKAQEELLKRISLDPTLEPQTAICLTEMSGIVRSSGYQAPTNVVAPGLKAGSTSPFKLALETAMEQDRAIGAQPGDLVIHVLIGDWLSSDAVADVIPVYRGHQDNFIVPVHAFVVNIGGAEVNHAIADMVSTRHIPFDTSESAIDEVMSLIFDLLKKTEAQGEAALNRMTSIAFSEM